MNEQEVNEKFDNLVKPQSVKPKKEPATRIERVQRPPKNNSLRSHQRSRLLRATANQAAQNGNQKWFRKKSVFQGFQSV